MPEWDPNRKRFIYIKLLLDKKWKLLKIIDALIHDFIRYPTWIFFYVLWQLINIYTLFNFFSPSLTCCIWNMNFLRHCCVMTPWLPEWLHMTTHDDKWQPMGSPMTTLLTESCNYFKTRKQPCKTFTQGKVHLYALFRHGRKYLWKKRPHNFDP